MSENLELYVRACLQRAVHIIIQSRCANGNNKRAVAKDLHTINSPDNGEGIFDLNLGKLKQFDHYETTKKLWKSLQKTNNQETQQLGLQIRINYAKTGKTIEIWKFHLDKQTGPEQQKLSFTEWYLRISNMLKSLLVYSRMSVTFMLAKEVSFDSFLSYNIEPCYEIGGGNLIGQLKSQIGIFTFVHHEIKELADSSIYDDARQYPEQQQQNVPQNVQYNNLPNSSHALGCHVQNRSQSSHSQNHPHNQSPSYNQNFQNPNFASPHISSPPNIPSPHAIAPGDFGYQTQPRNIPQPQITPNHYNSMPNQPFSPGSVPIPHHNPYPNQHNSSYNQQFNHSYNPTQHNHYPDQAPPFRVGSYQPPGIHNAYSPNLNNSPGGAFPSSLPINQFAYGSKGSLDSDLQYTTSPTEELLKSASKFVSEATRNRVERDNQTSMHNLAYSPNINPNTNPAHSTASSDMSQSVTSKRDVEHLLDLGKRMKADIDKMVQRPTTVKEEFLEMLEQAEDFKNDRDMFMDFAKNL